MGVHFFAKIIGSDLCHRIMLRRVAAVLINLLVFFSVAANAQEISSLPEPSGSFGLGHPLVDAADQGDFQMVVQLLKEGSPVDSHGDFGVTPLMRASFRGNKDIAEMLIKAGANVDAVDIGGATALHLAARNNHAELVKLLLKAGASIDMPDGEQWTALMRAVVNNNKDVMQILLSENANPLAENSHNRSAFTYAAERGKADVLRKILASPKMKEAKDSVLERALNAAKNKHREENIALLTRFINTGEVDDEASAAKAVASSDTVAEIAASALRIPENARKEKSADRSTAKDGWPPSPSAEKIGGEKLAALPSEIINTKQIPSAGKTSALQQSTGQIPAISDENSDIKNPPRIAHLPRFKNGFPQDNAQSAQKSPTPSDAGLAPENATSAYVAPDATTHSFLLQLGTFPSADQADAHWKNLSKTPTLSKTKPDIIRTLLGMQRNVVYRLRADGFAKRADAANACKQLRDKNIECFVIESALRASRSSASKAERKQTASKTSTNDSAKKISSEPEQAKAPASRYVSLAESAALREQSERIDDLPSLTELMQLHYENPEAAAKKLSSAQPIRGMPWQQQASSGEMGAAIPQRNNFAMNAKAPDADIDAAPILSREIDSAAYKNPNAIAPGRANIPAASAAIPAASAPIPAASAPIPAAATPAYNAAASNSAAPSSRYPVALVPESPNTYYPQNAAPLGVREAVAVPANMPLTPGQQMAMPNTPIIAAAPAPFPGTWLHIGDFPTEQAASDYWLRMFKYNNDLSYVNMTLSEPIADIKHGLGIKVGPILPAHAWNVCRLVNSGGYGCYVKGDAAENNVAAYQPQPQQNSYQMPNSPLVAAPQIASAYPQAMPPQRATQQDFAAAAAPSAPAVASQFTQTTRSYPMAVAGSAQNQNSSPFVFSALPQGNFWIHLGNFRSEGEAEYYWMVMQQDHPKLFGGLQHFVDSPGASDPGMRARLKLGPFPSGMLAERLCEDVRHNRVPCMILQ